MHGNTSKDFVENKVLNKMFGIKERNTGFLSLMKQNCTIAPEFAPEFALVNPNNKTVKTLRSKKDITENA